LANNWSWVTVPKNNFDIPANGNETIDFKIKTSAIPKSADSKDISPFAGYSGGKLYTGTIRVIATKPDGTTEFKEYPCNINKSHPNSY
jgi:hypothetical protein